MFSDTIADMLTRVRNALQNRKDDVVMPHARMRQDIADVLKREGYLRSVTVEGEGIRKVLRLRLKYGPNGEQVIRSISRISSSGRRLYRGLDRLPRVMGGLGIIIVSTSKGVLSDREARKQGIGGELICRVS